LLTLINQLLDISKMKSAVGEPAWRNGNIVAQIAMNIESYREYARMREVNFTAELCGEVQMDFVPDYVNKLMNNLLSNAFKYTPPQGTVSVKVRTDGQRLLMDVSDTGKGIPAESLPHIFEAFYQAENDGAKIGTGVGLALVKQIVDAIDGTISVESTVGQGCVFHVSLPIRQTKSATEPAQPQRADMRKPLLPTEGDDPTDTEMANDDVLRVLVIDDNVDVAAFIGSQLSDKYAIIYAHNGQDGLNKAEQMVPDVIVTDLMMPGVDGLEVCRRIRANEVTSHIPIIVVTAKITETDRVKGLEAGADAYLAKPFNRDELRMRVEKLLEQRRLLREKYAKLEETDKEDEQPQSEADRKFINKVTDTVYMLLNAGGEIDVTAVAEKMGMTYSQFYRKLSALTGCTPMGYILRIKIRKARLLIDKNPSMPFRDVAERCGFSDYSNFVRAFKNLCGITPTQYVRQKE
ncbi:hybrid sensor histidine kinase/response regulator transcription factor, partial [Prevotella conceptionensis]|uniref:hybrid sensor histidine kinase/response regulator transcription factor n=1 Tax=Prevotella conceptionensis TaxID=340486 RepID=UPI0005C62934